MNMSLVFAQKNLIFSVERFEFEMAVLKQRHIDGERREFQDKWTSQYFFIANRRNSCGFSFFRKHHHIPSDVDRLANDTKCQTSH